MGTKKITYNDKVSIVPPGVRENQVWDLDMNEIKSVVNDNADELIAMRGLLNSKTVSLTVPSGVPSDGDEWILYTF